MRTDDIDLFGALLKQRSGLVLTRDKAYLLEARLGPVARKWRFKGVAELADCLRDRPEEALLRAVTEAMMTNESSFFRDGKPFETLMRVALPRLMRDGAGRRLIRIWSAACSSGQEAYSMCMALEEAGFSSARFEIVGSDLSSAMIERARSGIYTQYEVQRGLPIQYLIKYFEQIDDKWQVNARIRSMVSFREHNLLDDPGPLGRFDIVFCRNVLIYFDQTTRKQVLERIAERMPDDGILCLGGTETIIGITDRFTPMDDHHGFFVPAGARVSSAQPIGVVAAD